MAYGFATAEDMDDADAEDAALRASAADCVLDDARHQALVESARLSGSDKINTVPTPPPPGDARQQADVREHVRKLVGKQAQWRGCLSYHARTPDERRGVKRGDSTWR